MTSVANSWRQRGLLLSFFRRDIHSRYSGTIGGVLWAFGQPAITLLIYSFVFNSILKVKFAELGDYSFTAFLACALWPWMAFQEGVQRATHAVVGNAGLIKKIRFPHEFLVLASVAATFAVHAAGFAIVLVILSAFGEPFNISGIPSVVFVWTILFVLACGLAFVTSAAQVFLKDVDHMIAPLLMIWFYATPVLYPLSQVPVQLQTVFALNPLAHLVEAIRSAMMFDGHEQMSPLLVVFAAACGFLIAARVFFKRLSDVFEDFL